MFLTSLKNEEVALELRTNHGAPIDVQNGLSVDFVWKSTSFDRMQCALRKFASDEMAVSSHLYHHLLGHVVSDTQEPAELAVKLPKKISVAGLCKVMCFP